MHNTPDIIKNEPNKHPMFKVVLNNKYTANNVINGQEYIIGETIDGSLSFNTVTCSMFAKNNPDTDTKITQHTS